MAYTMTDFNCIKNYLSDLIANPARSWRLVVKVCTNNEINYDPKTNYISHKYAPVICEAYEISNHDCCGVNKETSTLICASDVTVANSEYKIVENPTQWVIDEETCYQDQVFDMLKLIPSTHYGEIDGPSTQMLIYYSTKSKLDIKLDFKLNFWFCDRCDEECDISISIYTTSSGKGTSLPKCLHNLK